MNIKWIRGGTGPWRRWNVSHSIETLVDAGQRTLVFSNW